MAEDNKVDELSVIYSSLSTPSHILHLYSPAVDKYKLHASFFDKEEKTAYVTFEDSKFVADRFAKLDLDLTIVKPENITEIEKYDRAIIDVGSEIEKFSRAVEDADFSSSLQKEKNKHRKIGEKVIKRAESNHAKRENYLAEISEKLPILCAYDISKLDSEEIKGLAAQHDKLIVTADSRKVKPSLHNSFDDVNAEKVEQFVKNELESIVLALTLKKPLCGLAIKEQIHKKFDVLLSSGTLYPLLHKLETKGLLEAKSGIKTKRYAPVDKEKIVAKLDEHMQAKNFLNGFLETTMNSGEIAAKGGKGEE